LKFIPGHDGTNIYPLRTVEDANTIYSIVDDKDVVIVGSSFIGMETASCIVKKCRSLFVIGMEKAPFERVLGIDIGTILQKFHEINGVKFILNAVVQQFVKQDDVVVKLIVKIKNPETEEEILEELSCDILILGAGVTCGTDYIHNDKINKDKDRSIKVDEYLYTGKDGLYAGGDIARYPWKFLPGKMIRIEHWGMAQIHGQVVAKNMVRGNVVKCEHVPFFWTQQYGSLSVKYAGHALEYQRVIIDHGEEIVTYENPKFAAYYINNGVAIAICSINRDPISSSFAEILNAGIEIREEQLEQSIHETKSTDELIERFLRQINHRD